MLNLYGLLQEMIDYHNRCVIVIMFLHIFYALTFIPMMIHDLKCKTKPSAWSIIFYSASFGLSLLILLQIVAIANEDGINGFIRFISVAVSFAINMVTIWFMVVMSNRDK